MKTNNFIISSSTFRVYASQMKNRCVIVTTIRFKKADSTKSPLTLYFIMLKNGQAYFKNLAVFTPQDF